MLNETTRSMPDPAETLYAGSGIQLTKSGMVAECHWTVTQGTRLKRQNVQEKTSRQFHAW